MSYTNLSQSVATVEKGVLLQAITAGVVLSYRHNRRVTLVRVIYVTAGAVVSHRSSGTLKSCRFPAVQSVSNCCFTDTRYGDDNTTQFIFDLYYLYYLNPIHKQSSHTQLTSA